MTGVLGTVWSHRCCPGPDDRDVDNDICHVGDSGDEDGDGHVIGDEVPMIDLDPPLLFKPWCVLNTTKVVIKL